MITRILVFTRRRLHWIIVPSAALILLAALIATAISARHHSSMRLVLNIAAIWLIATAAVYLLVASASARLSALRDLIDRAERDGGAPVERFPARLELNGIVRALNKMRGRLNSRITRLERDQREQAAVLASMIEGVIAVDRTERILRMNGAAARLLDADPVGAKGRSMQEVVRNTDVQRLIMRTLRDGQPRTSEIAVHTADGGERLLGITSLALMDNAGAALGALLVLNDLTALRRLESLRRDFVSNVSHELRTPLTALKGYIETLIDGAIDDPDDARRFLAIMDRQADRLNLIFEDLLSLARIEQGQEANTIELSRANVREVLERAVDAVAPRAAKKSISIDLSCPPVLQGAINANLIEQALTNLLDNAVKYSEPGKSVSVSASLRGEMLEIEVADQGYGIHPDHLPRIFERFYTADRARSRREGGTGLGLSIVKHIAEAHGGSAKVQSKPGTGSTFVISFPRDAGRTPQLSGV